MTDNKLLYEDLTYKINGILFSVHNELGKYINEQQICDAIEAKFKTEKINYEREKILPPSFAGEKNGRNRVDFIVENVIILEIKNKQIVERADYSQLLRYLSAENKKLGLLANFGAKYLKIKRVLNPNSNELSMSPRHPHICKSAPSAYQCLKVKIKRTDKSLPLPEYHTPGSVAFDFSASATTVIPPKQLVKIPTELIIAAPPGYGLIIAGRSSLAYKKGLMLSNGIGVVDTDYCGEDDKIYISVYNFTDQEAVVEKGERVAQGMFIKIEKAEWDEVEKMDDQNRGGWGSTG